MAAKREPEPYPGHDAEQAEKPKGTGLKPLTPEDFARRRRFHKLRGDRLDALQAMPVTRMRLRAILRAAQDAQSGAMNLRAALDEIRGQLTSEDWETDPDWLVNAELVYVRESKS